MVKAVLGTATASSRTPIDNHSSFYEANFK